MFWVLAGIKDQYNLANKNIPLLEAAQLSDYPQRKESKTYWQRQNTIYTLTNSG